MTIDKVIDSWGKAPDSVANDRDRFDMNDIYKARRDRLISVANELFDYGVQKELAKRVGISPNYMSKIFSDPRSPAHKKIGEELARHIELKLNKPMYWLDGSVSYEFDSDWPFDRIDTDRIAGLDNFEKNQIESVIETMLDNYENQKSKDLEPEKT